MRRDGLLIPILMIDKISFDGARRCLVNRRGSAGQCLPVKWWSGGNFLPKGIAPTTWLRRAAASRPCPSASRPRHGELQFFNKRQILLAKASLDRTRRLRRSADRRAPGRAHDWGCGCPCRHVEDEILELDQLAFGHSAAQASAKSVLAIGVADRAIAQAFIERAKASSAADSGR